MDDIFAFIFALCAAIIAVCITYQVVVWAFNIGC